MRTINICVNDFQIRGFHGVHPLEKKTGCIFSIDLCVSFQKEAHIQQLDDSIDYENLLAIIKRHMQTKRDLLETVCQDILDEIYKTYPEVSRVEITIRKLDPPVENFKGSLSVNMVQIR